MNIKLDTLRKQAESLNKATEELNEVVKALHDELDSMSLGIKIVIDTPQGRFGYVRAPLAQGSRFRFGKFLDDKFIQFNELTRTGKIELASNIPALLDALSQNAEQLIDKAIESSRIASTSLKLLLGVT